jgi:hypothetical protein
LIAENPQRHSATVRRPGSISVPSIARSATSPRRMSGPFSYSVTDAPPGSSGAGRPTGIEVMPMHYPPAAAGKPQDTGLARPEDTDQAKAVPGSISIVACWMPSRSRMAR